VIAEETLLLSGLKYHDNIVRTRSRIGGNISPIPSRTIICEIAAPDIAKKKPA
jgi:hypothetical protein